MIRHLARWLALLLVPVLIVTLPNVAQAAEVRNGTAATVSFEVQAEAIPGYGNWATCDVTAYFRGDLDGEYSAVVHGQIGCDTGYNIDTLVVGFTLDGGSCDYAHPAEEMDDTGSVPFQLVTTDEAGYDATGCAVTELCWTASMGAHSGWRESGYSDCVAFPLGAPPLGAGSVGDCQYATFEPPLTEAAYTINDLQKGWAQRVRMNFTGKGGASPWTWNMYVVLESPSGAASMGVTQDWNDYLDRNNMARSVNQGTNGFTGRQWYKGGSLETSFGVTSGVSGQATWAYGASTHWSSGPGAAPMGKIVGVGVIGQKPSTATSADRLWTTGMSGSTEGKIGLTIPSECTFYWGVKIAQDTAATRDEPVSGLGADPVYPNVGTSEPPPMPADPVVEEGCEGFSLSDPASWAGAGICQLVKLMDSLLSKMRSLIGAVRGIAAAILDGLLGLFVPSDGFLEAKGEAMQEAWSTTPPAVFIDSAQVVGESLVVASPGGGCSGPDWTFTPPIADGPVTLHPFSTCEGAMGTIATIIRAALTAGVYVGGFLVALRVVAAAFGVQLNFGRGDES